MPNHVHVNPIKTWVIQSFLRDVLDFSETKRVALLQPFDYLVGPLGVEPSTNGL